MLNSRLGLLAKRGVADFLPRARQFFTELAEDFWHDGTENPFSSIRLPLPQPPRQVPVPRPSVKKVENAPVPAEVKQWQAAPGEISEKMWGDGFVTPGGGVVTEILIAPLGLNKNMSVLDLSAGLGGRMRTVVEKFGVYVTGFEPDPQIAARGMELSVRAGKGKHSPIMHYNPDNFSLDRKYDCIIMCETFYRVANKSKFIETITESAKPKAQMSFTDYVVNPEDNEKPAIVAWRAYEKGVTPLGLVQMAEAWAKGGFMLRVNDDQTAFYDNEVKEGLKRLGQFLATNPPPDVETKKALARRIQLWTHRMAAIDQGMKFIRFYGTKR